VDLLGNPPYETSTELWRPPDSWRKPLLYPLCYGISYIALPALDLHQVDQGKRCLLSATNGMPFK